ncbi:MAG: hypothetical protein DMD60_06705 [Gemmatimonadetes bacterium]|nr:MAG: hypothetical protein DMD60_06705 [Gemmatimonadota bacterium]
MLRAALRRELPRHARGGLVVTRLSLAVLCAIPLLVALPNRLDAQGGTIRGRVADAQGAPLARASVSVDAIGARATTDEQGSYEIRGVPAGTYTVRVRLLGYVPQSVQVTASGTQPTRQDLSRSTSSAPTTSRDKGPPRRARSCRRWLRRSIFRTRASPTLGTLVARSRCGASPPIRRWCC